MTARNSPPPALDDDFPEACDQADQVTSGTFPLGLVAHVLAAAYRGDREKTARNLAQLFALQPRWRDNPRAELEKLLPDSTIVQRLANDLAAAGT